MTAYEKMKELVEKLNRYAKLYYEEDAPTVSDAEYDALYDELRALEESEGYSLKNSPTHRVGGAPQKKFAESRHLLRLYSLDKCKSTGIQVRRADSQHPLQRGQTAKGGDTRRRRDRRGSHGTGPHHSGCAARDSL